MQGLKINVYIFFEYTCFLLRALFSRVPKLLVFMSEIKNDLSLKKSNFLFLFCLKIAIK